MKLAEVVAKFIESQGVKYVFGVSGGASLHLIHGIVDATQIQFIPTTHECNAGFAADAYARLSGLGVCLATSGPGATNLVTAIAASYCDSVPVLYITGNVATHRFGKPFGVRQYGFQELDIVGMTQDITKYSAQMLNPDNVVFQLWDCITKMRSGRPGPGLIDIPDDIQRAHVNTR